MTAEILDGALIAEQVRAQVKEDVAAWVASGKPAPGLATVLVGDNPASAVYVRSKQKACAENDHGSEFRGKAEIRGFAAAACGEKITDCDEGKYDSRNRDGEISIVRVGSQRARQRDEGKRAHAESRRGFFMVILALDADQKSKNQ